MILMSAGTFIDFYLSYAGVSAEDQAKAILQKGRELIQAGAKGVGITYSANYGQTRTIEETYQKGAWYTGTIGAGQAKVMHAMENLLKSDPYQDLQGKVRIMPITTMTFEHTKYAWNEMHMGVVKTDLARIKKYLDDGWTILGWQNQDTVKKKDHPYAVGGGVASDIQAEVVEEIQNTLKQFAVDYQKEDAS
jgi:hypothetical protein